MNRVATLAQHTVMLDSISKTQNRVFERQAQIASGKEARTFDDIARESQRLIGFENQMARAEEFIKQNGVIEARIQVMDSALNGILEVASDLKVRLLQRVDSSTGTAGDLAGEGASMLDTVVGLINTQINGRFLFAGSATQTSPVSDPVPDPTTFGVAEANYYQGDSVQLTARVSEGIEVAYGVPGGQPAFQQIIGALKAAIEGDTQDDAGLLNSAITLVDQAIDNLSTERTKVGSAGNVVARATAIHQDFRLYAEGVIGEIENVDVPATIAALTADETVLQASFITVGRMTSLTLADFLR